MGVGGFTGEGKTTFSTKVQKAYAKVSGMKWDFSKMTWSRKEMLTWIDGENGSKTDPKTGLKLGQLPEYSAILPDELFLMFYSRNWFEQDQIDALATFNMCRDRHLFLAGNTPDFWDLDSGFRKRIRFYAYIPTRGVAWVFQQENNPFSADPWNVNENKKIFRKTRNPYKCPNFICEIHYDDWDEEEKREYLKIRNTKRVNAVSDNKNNKLERYANIKEQRSVLLKLLTEYNQAVYSVLKEHPEVQTKLKERGFEGVFTNKYLSQLLDVDAKTIANDKYGRIDNT